MKEADDLIIKAKRFLRTAYLALNDIDYDSCASRSYYANVLCNRSAFVYRKFKSIKPQGRD